MIQLRDDLKDTTWREALSRLPELCRDVYFLPSYHNLHVANKEGIARCTVLEDANNQLLIPGLDILLPNSISNGEPQEYFDLQSCNGYGGPLASPGVSAEFLSDAWGKWKVACSGKKIIAGFFRLHPLIDNERWLPMDAKILVDRKTAFVDLAEGVDAAFKRADSKHRNMVNKGRREGLAIRWNETNCWNDFESLYGDAMVRLNAPPSLRFSPAYFANLRAMPEAELACVYLNGKLSSGAVFLSGPIWCHYHISARSDDAPNHLTNCLLQAAIERAAGRNLKGLHLGGGRSRAPTDSLLKFKLSLGGTLLDFKVALVITCHDRFDEFTRRWIEKNGCAPQWLLSYRQPTLTH